jgi:hypothetical protein
VNPIALQALVATHTQSMTGSSKETLMQAASKKRKQMNETMSGSAIKQPKLPTDPLTSRSVHDNVHTFLQEGPTNNIYAHSNSVME